jgi:predicted RNase H-like HicB family nuclease
MRRNTRAGHSPAVAGREDPMLLTAILMPATEGGFVATNPETGTTSQGETVEEAIANLREATALYLEEFPLAVAGRPLITTFEVVGHA